MAAPAVLCLLLVFPLSSSQSTPQSEQENSAHPPPPPAPAPPHIQELLQNRETIHLNVEQARRWSRTLVHGIRSSPLASDMADVPD